MERWPLWAGRGVIWQFLFVESTTCLLFQLHAFDMLTHFLEDFFDIHCKRRSWNIPNATFWGFEHTMTNFLFFFENILFLCILISEIVKSNLTFTVCRKIYSYTTLRAIVKSFPISMLHFLDSPRSCIPGRASFNVTLTEGTQAGMFRYLGKNFNISECIAHACALGYGDYVYMIEDICFVVECYPEKKCDLKNSPESTDIAVRLKWSGKTGNWKKVERKQNHQCAFSLNSASFSEAAILFVSC